MRLIKRGQTAAQCRGREMRCAARPLSGLLTRFRYGQYVQDMLRLLLPCDAVIVPGDKITVAGTPYVCVAIHAYPGHLQADVRRCAG